MRMATITNEIERTQQQIKDNIKQFEILALLRLLKHLNYTRIWFRSNDSFISQERLIHSIQFSHQRVIITLNIGLLGPQSALPTYIMRMRETLIDKDDEFKVFIGYFDHILILNIIKNSFPEFDQDYWGQFGKDTDCATYPTSATYAKMWLQLLNLKTKRSCHVVFAAIFPECKIVCESNKPLQCISLNKTRLGNITMGSPYQLGDMNFSSESGLVVFIDNSQYQLPLNVLKERLHRLVLPLYAPLMLLLDVRIIGVIEPLRMACNKSELCSESAEKLTTEVNQEGNQEVKHEREQRVSDKVKGKTSLKLSTQMGVHPLLNKPTQGWANLYFGQTYQSETPSNG